MKKSLIGILATIMVIGLVFSGCSKTPSVTSSPASSSSIQSSSSSVSTTPKPKIKIFFWHSLGATGGDIIKALVADFNSSQNEVDVLETFQGGYVDTAAKIMTAVAAKTPPAVAMIERAYVTQMAPDGILEDLQKYVDRDKFDMKDFIDGLMGFSYYDNKLLSLPLNRSTPIMYYNITKFKELGLNPKGPQNWTDWKEYAKKLTGNGAIGFECANHNWILEALVLQSGGSTLNADYTNIGYNNEAGVAALEFWRGMLKDGVMKSNKSDGWADAKNDFATQKTFMIIDSTSTVKGLLKQVDNKFEMGACFIPGNKTFGAPTGGANMSILAAASTEQKEAAWKFVKWLKSPAQDFRFAKETGYIATLKSVNNLQEMKDYYVQFPQFKVAMDQLQYAKDSTRSPKWAEAQTIIQKYLDSAMIDMAKTTVQQILDGTSTDVGKLLKK